MELLAGLEPAALHHTPKENVELRISDLKFDEGDCEGSREELNFNSELRNPQFKFRNPKFFSALHADHLLDLSDDFNQVFLIFHYRFD